MEYRDLVHDPRRALLGQLTLYYIVLSVGYFLLVTYLPETSRYFYAWTGEQGNEPSRLLGQLTGDNELRALQADTMVSLFVSMVGALLLMLPVTWVYLGTRRRRGLNQSLIETLMILPIAVSGVIVIVQDSLALAFSLAGIFAGIQFRSRLKVYADAHFLFASIGVGLAAGIGALHIATVMSIVFNYTVYILWRVNYGAESGERHMRFASEIAREEAHRRRDERHHEDEHHDSAGIDRNRTTLDRPGDPPRES